MTPVTRSQTHITDTLAVRSIISQFPADWIIRGLEERDYGIDLTLEVFNGEQPTGKFALVQVKGTQSPFRNEVKMSFPAKTIDYSLLFPEPFFVFYHSISDGETYFLWLQKYAETRLKLDTRNWKSQEKVTLYFPKSNKLTSGKDRILAIMAKHSARNESVEFLADFEWLKEHWHSFTNGTYQQIEACIRDLNRIEGRTNFLSVYLEDYMDLDLAALRNSFEMLKVEVSAKSPSKASLEIHIAEADCQIEHLDQLKKQFFAQGEIDEFCVENSDSYPY